ncbi:hypothetical protein P12x_005290 [Tundrisphaera lichenicola]|uniref:hypothetical protein n=1 Tax=Tundrisphaera lichenicola TaxID=2029860 RepID=UPI003EB93B33
MSRTLIEKLCSCMYRLQRRDYEQGYNAGVTKSISIVRQHEAEQPLELVERVAKAISAWRWDQKTDEPWERLKPSVQEAYRDQARAAITVMGAGTGSAPDAQGVSDNPLGNLGTIPPGGNPAAPASEAYRQVEEALAFYANPQNWWCRNADGLGYHHANLSGSMERLNAQVGIIEHRPNFVHEQFYNDCGKRGKEALAALPAMKPKAPDAKEQPDEQPAIDWNLKAETASHNAKHYADKCIDLETRLSATEDAYEALRNSEPPVRESSALGHIFETENWQNPYRARIIDLCYTAFLMAREPNKEDGGASDWFNDTLPHIKAQIERMERNVVEGQL